MRALRARVVGRLLAEFDWRADRTPGKYGRVITFAWVCVVPSALLATVDWVRGSDFESAFDARRIYVVPALAVLLLLSCIGTWRRWGAHAYPQSSPSRDESKPAAGP